MIKIFGSNFFMLFFFCQFIELGCQEHKKEEKQEIYYKMNQDEWFKHRDENSQIEGKNFEVDKNRYHYIIEDFLVEAIKRLENDQVIEITDEMVKKYTGNQITTPIGLKSYLVRGLLIKGSRKEDIVVYHSDEKFLIINYKIGINGNKTDKFPLIIFTNKKPKDVFVEVFKIG